MPMVRKFPDRKAAGRALADAVQPHVTGPAVVLGVPNGGVVVARPIAKVLGVPLDIAWVRKVVRPSEPDVVLGAVDLDGAFTVNPVAAQAADVGNELLTELAFHTHEKLVSKAGDVKARIKGLLLGRTVVVVDDGIMTGLTLIAALRWARRQGALRRIVAVPVVDERIWRRVEEHADVAVALEARDDGPIARSDVYEDYRSVPSDIIASIVRTRAPEGAALDSHR